MPELLVVSLNLRGVHDRWRKRAPLVVDGLAPLNPDVICLQEAATWRLQARCLARRLTRRTGRAYHVAQARKGGYRGLFEGLAIISALPLQARGRLVLGDEGRVAQRATVRPGGVELVVANTHLDHRADHGANRIAQAKRLARWLEGPRPLVLCGDFNDRPGSATLDVFRSRFTSAHALCGFEVAGTAPAWESGRVIDYILVPEGVRALDAGVCLDEPTAGAWPSDHVGLWANLEV